MKKHFAYANAALSTPPCNSHRVGTILSLIFALTLGFSANAMAGDKAGVWTDGACTVKFNVNGSEQTKNYNKTGATTYAIGDVTSLSFTYFEYHTWHIENEGNICGGDMYYRIYSGSTASGSFTKITGDTNYGEWEGSVYPKKRNPKHSKTVSIDLMDGIVASGTYTFEYYFYSKGNSSGKDGCNENDGALYLNNGGSNYKATFVYTAPAPDPCPNCKTITK